MKMRSRTLALALLLAGSVPASTILKLSLDEMIDRSTLIVRGTMSGCHSAERNSMIYTECVIAVTERLKGFSQSEVLVSLPGGSARGLKQVVPGAPKLRRYQDYVFFLWTSPRGVTQVLGLSQGLLEVRMAGGAQTAERGPIADATVVDGSGAEIADQGVRLNLNDLRNRVSLRNGGAAR
jgi:hypothetical protein